VEIRETTASFQSDSGAPTKSTQWQKHDYHGLYGHTSCCISQWPVSQWPSQWVWANFDPPPLPTAPKPLKTDFDEIRTLELPSEEQPPRKIHFDPTTWVVSANTQFATVRSLSLSFFTGSIARSTSRRYLVYSEADFEVFRPAVATYCTDEGKIWHEGGEVPSFMPNFTPPSVQ